MGFLFSFLLKRVFDHWRVFWLWRLFIFFIVFLWWFILCKPFWILIPFQWIVMLLVHSNNFKRRLLRFWIFFRFLIYVLINWAKIFLGIFVYGRSIFSFFFLHQILFKNRFFFPRTYFFHKIWLSYLFGKSWVCLFFSFVVWL